MDSPLFRNLQIMNVQAMEEPRKIVDLLPGKYTQFNDKCFSCLESDDIIVGKCEVEQFNHLEDDIEAAYLEMLSLITHRGKKHLWRCWNKIPHINQQERGTERYQLFCTGRHRAFVGTKAIHETDLPAATAVGTDDTFISLTFIASKTKGYSIENPNQIRAYRYPRQYGQDSPLFSRAYLASEILFVSGTASIRGHQSLHGKDLIGQLNESLQRIRELTVNKEVKLLRAYVRDADNLPTVDAFIRRAYPQISRIQLEKADICRKELLVEIEVVAK